MKIEKYNDQPASIEDALKNPNEVISILINFEKGGVLDAQIVAFSNLKYLTLLECPKELQLPDEIVLLENFTHLNISVSERRGVKPKKYSLKLPKIINKLKLEELKTGYGGYADIQEILALKTLKSLEYTLGNFKEDSALIATHLTNLQKLSLSGFEGFDAELSPMIKNLRDLEELELLFCTMLTLPDEIAELSKLKILKLIHLHMSVFPEAVTKLQNLEKLEYTSRIATLPDSMTNLENLKILDFSGAFNGEFLYYDNPKGLRPIPDVIGKLKSVTSLNLSYCGIDNLDFLSSLNTLEKLSLKFSRLKTCDSFLPFIKLEELSLNNSDSLKDISALAKLPALKRLSLNSTGVQNLDPIREMQALEYLNIKSCWIKDVKPLYDRPVKELEAESMVFERLSKLEEEKNLLPVDQCLELLKSEDSEKIESGLFQLSKNICLSSERESNIFNVFGIDASTDKDSPTEIDELDSILNDHIDSLSSDVLVEVVRCSLVSVYDNYNAAVIAINALISREDADAQNQIVDIYIESCNYYDAGHRAFKGTVQDMLIDDLFSEFEAEPLVRLLEWCRTDHLYNNGDGMEGLFISAFDKTEDPDLRERLRNRFINYFNDVDDYMDEMKELLSQIEETGEEEVGLRLNKTLSKINILDVINNDLASDDVSKIEYWLLQAGKELTPEIIEEVDTAINKAINKHLDSLSYSAIWNYFSCLTTSISAVYGEVINFLTLKDERFASDIKKFVVANPELKDNILGNLWCGIKLIYRYKFPTEKKGIKILQILRVIIMELEQIDENGFLSKNISWQIHSACNNDQIEFLESSIEQLKDLKNKIDLDPVNNPSTGELLTSKISYIAKSDQLWVCKYASLIIDKINPDFYYFQRILAQLIGCAVVTKNLPVLNEALKVVPEKTTWDILAYNTARAYALLGDKKLLLEHIKRSILLGKTKEQFMKDNDFEPYLKDNDFMEALSGK